VIFFCRRALCLLVFLPDCQGRPSCPEYRVPVNIESCGAAFFGFWFGFVIVCLIGAFVAFWFAIWVGDVLEPSSIFFRRSNQDRRGWCVLIVDLRLSHCFFLVINLLMENPCGIPFFNRERSGMLRVRAVFVKCGASWAFVKVR